VSWEQLSHLVKRPRDDLVSVRVVECNGIHHILVAFQGQLFIARLSVPHLACAIIAARDEAITYNTNEWKTSI
jgi:hypothetical protein